MKDTKLINDLLDGNLKLEFEEDLYRSLLLNEDLRKEMRHFISLKNAIRSDFKAFNPSPASTLNIFNTLGFNAPIVNQNISATNQGSSFFNFIRKNKKSIFTNLASALVGGIIVFILFKSIYNNTDIEYTKKDNSIYSSNQENNKVNNPNSKNSNNLLSIDNEKQVQLNQSNTKTKIVTKYIYLDKETKSIIKDEPKLNSDISEVNENIKLVNSESNFNDFKEFRTLESFTQEQRKQISPTSEINTKEFMQLLDNYNLSLEFAGSQYLNTMDENIEPSKYQFFNNYNLNLLYNLSLLFKTGISLRRENFFQTFTGIDSIGNTYKYEQKPNFTTIGLLTRYNLFNASMLSPFLQLDLGINQTGFVGRGSFGTEINAYQGLNFVLGIDYSYFLYKHQNNYYNSNKIGINYGIKFSY